MTARLTETMRPGAMWSARIPRHRHVRLTTRGPGANVSALLYNAANPLDRLNIPDTLKALHTAKLTRGHVLMSDLGHALASIVEDSVGWHDPLAGHSDATFIAARYGGESYQEFRNDFHRNARDNFLIELGKHGRGLPDLVANVNFFSKVQTDDAGQLDFIPDHAPAGATLVLRTDVDLLLVLANCPHPMDESETYPSQPIEIEITKTDPPTEDDFCRTFRPENARALALTARLLDL